MAGLFVACVAVTAAAAPAASTSDAIIAALQQVATEQSAKYNMSIALAFHQPSTSADPLAVAAGFTDSGLGLGTPTRRADPYDKYVWGSTTKMFTAPAVLQLVERGVVGLDDPCAKHIDPILQQLNGTTLASSLGADVASVTIRQLLHMESGVRDYDNDNYTRAQFADRAHEFGPVETLGFVEPGLRFPAGSRQSYCSANYVLLGLVLARHWHDQQGAGAAWSWQAYDQRTVIPSALRALFPNSTFADAKPCSAWTPVHGFMGHYEGSDLPAQDVWDVSCVGGWTGGNYVGSVSDVARYTYDLYSVGGPVVSAASQALLTNFTAAGGGSGGGHSDGGFKFYGMGTFSLDWSIGDGEGYGHVGDTYGYQSQTTFFPAHNFVLTVATNVETTSQAQPADATCVGYHAVLAAMQGTPPPTCTFNVPHHFIGTCNCTSASAA